jgi:hypothetical protein
VATVASLAAATVAMLLIRHSANDPNLIPLAVMACAAAAGIGWGALRLTRGRHEWRIGTGSLTQRWRFGGRVRDTFNAASLELTQSSDSDGDDWFALEAVAPGAAEFPAAARRRGRRTIARALRDPAVPKQIGRWLEHRARLPLADRTTRDARAQEAQKALAQLRETGPFGRWAAGWLERLEAKRRGG